MCYFIGWYEMTKSRRLLGQEQTGPTKGGGSSLIGKPKNKPYDDPCCHNYYHPWSSKCKELRPIVVIGYTFI